MKQNAIFLFVIALSFECDASGLCKKDERTYFSCTSQGRIIALWGLPKAGNSGGYLQYRFGKNSNEIELEFPSKVGPAEKYFTYGDTPYSRGWRVSVNFNVNSFYYSIHNALITDGWPGYSSDYRSGVMVFKGGEQISDIKCDRFSKFEVSPSKIGIPYKDAP